MKHYFLKKTGEELQFGDMIELDFTKDLEDGGVKYHHMECRFIPELVPLLVENDIIDVTEEEDKEITIEDVIQRLDRIEEILNTVLNHQKKYVKKDTRK